MKKLVAILALCLWAMAVPAQQPRLATLSGHTTDADGAEVAGASVKVDGPTTADHFSTTSDSSGFFEVIGVRPGVAYRVTVVAAGFTPVAESGIIVAAGQLLEIPSVVLTPNAEFQVAAISANEAAQMEVKQEESQRVLGVFPNFYVVYGNTTFTALPAKLKFHLAFKATIDPVTFGSVAFLSGIDQAADTPSFVQGAKGFGQRMGANYVDTAGNILIGGAILPVMFHQDPRYFVQGTGTKKSRALHAIEAPFITKGDNGRPQFNISSIGGDFVSGSLQNVYYPRADRGVGLTMSSVGLATAGRVVNALFQEFVFGRFTTNSNHH